MIKRLTVVPSSISILRQSFTSQKAPSKARRGKLNMSDVISSQEVMENLKLLQSSLHSAYDSAPTAAKAAQLPRLVAVSKTKPVSLIRACYQAGQRVFGENYINELLEKQQAPEILEECPDIQWHFIGLLQSNKISGLAKVAGLSMVETLSSAKHAELLDKSWGKEHEDRLGVLVQVNTSQEDHKGGLHLNDAITLANFICDSCPGLEFKGFMTIGSLEQSHSNSESNPDFQELIRTRAVWCESRGVPVGCVELSMGMSADFQLAVQMGSSNVRVGSTIFGLRR